MAIRAADPITPFWYTPDSEKNKENPTRFHLKPLNGVEMFEVRSRIKMEDGQYVASADCARAVLRSGIVGWENFEGADGQVKFDVVDRARNLDHIPFKLVAELFSAIINRSTLSETERKN